jgi:hypothetical protein
VFTSEGRGGAGELSAQNETSLALVFASMISLTSKLQLNGLNKLDDRQNGSCLLIYLFFDMHERRHLTAVSCRVMLTMVHPSSIHGSFGQPPSL